MFSKAKIVRLGQIFTDLKNDNKELQVHTSQSTPPEQVMKSRSNIEDMTSHIEDCEKMAKEMAKETT